MPNFKVEGQAVPYLSDFTAAELPRFATVTRGQHNCIVSPSGITYLPKCSFKQVYMGSKYHAIDCHGIPWEKKTELKKITAGEKVTGKKEARVETQADINENFFLLERYSSQQISDYLSTLPGYTGPTSPKLSTNKKEYRIKKSLVRSRILAYTKTKKGYRHLYFFTITFPAGMSDALGLRCLNTWLTALRKQNLIREYLWVAERQPDTGTIHFHMAVPHYMKIQLVNGIMRKVLLNYAKEKVIPFSQAQFHPGKYNGVDVAGTRLNGAKTGPKTATNFAAKGKSGSLAHYLTKYVSKNNETFEQLAWHNSRGFSKLFFAIALTESQIRVSGLASWLHTDADKRFEKYELLKSGEQVLDDKGKPILLMLFVPWRRNAPDKFWDEVNKVNNFYQDMDDLKTQLQNQKN